jgi:hypothetical protein
MRGSLKTPASSRLYQSTNHRDPTQVSSTGHRGANETKVVPAQTVFSYRCTHPPGQTIKSAAHVRCLGPKPDARPLRSIQRSQARQTDHASTSSTASNARK